MADSNIDHKESPRERASSLPQRTQNQSLRPIASAFGKAVDNLSFLGITPSILVSYGYREASEFGFFMELAKVDDIKSAGFDDWFAKVSARVAEVAKNDEARAKFTAHLRETAARQLEFLSRDEYVGPALRSLRLARLVLTWTVFECLAGDAWEAAVNERPMGLGQGAIRSLPSEQSPESGVSSRHVSVGLLARYGFDLRKKLGTVLRPKFDFTSVSGIQDAYESLYGKGQALLQIFSARELLLLECTRHLIVHRGGTVDDEFVRRTNSNAPIGSPVHVEEEQIENMLNAAAVAGVELLEFVDKSLSRPDT